MLFHVVPFPHVVYVNGDGHFAAAVFTVTISLCNELLIVSNQCCLHLVRMHSGLQLFNLLSGTQ